jgi:sterol desaturase/sphingolipid hydroxylase (fatty acid hydroxylase superfamily)
MLRSIKIWLSINVPIIAYSCINYDNISRLSDSSILGIPVYYLTELVKNITLINVMNTDKPLISDRTSPSITDQSIMINLGTTSLVKAVVQNYISINLINPTQFSTYLISSTQFPIHMSILNILHIPIILLSFLYKSFIFELIFDFFHYWLHRLLHTYPILYRHIHKKHHKYPQPSATTAFYMSVPDLIISHCIPLLLSIYIMSQNQYTIIDKWEFMLINTYLSYQEVGGHLGRWMDPTSSFAQFIWLPKWLGIELYTEDHDLHHSQIVYNYSKRFSLWDKLFGTFKSNPKLPQIT